MSDDARRTSLKLPAVDRGAFYRQVRALHGYLSALSFVVLMAFSVTGVLLNHPHWVAGTTKDGTTLVLTKDELARAVHAGDKARALAEMVGAKVPLRGLYKSGEIIDHEAQLRFDGVSGTSDISVDLGTGATEVARTKASLPQILDDLHRGKNAGPVWAAVIDISAVLIFAMSALGYLIFLSLRFRLRTALVLTGLSVVALAGVYAICVP